MTLGFVRKSILLVYIDDRNYTRKAKEGYAVGGLWITNILPIFKTKMLIFPSKANLDKKILFGKIMAIRNGYQIALFVKHGDPQTDTLLFGRNGITP